MFCLDMNSPDVAGLSRWAIVAVCSGTATLCLDLTDPFRGRFSVVTATAQIVRLEDLLVDDVDAAVVWPLVDDAQTPGRQDPRMRCSFTP